MINRLVNEKFEYNLSVLKTYKRKPYSCCIKNKSCYFLNINSNCNCPPSMACSYYAKRFFAFMEIYKSKKYIPKKIIKCILSSKNKTYKISSTLIPITIVTRGNPYSLKEQFINKLDQYILYYYKNNNKYPKWSNDNNFEIEFIIKI